ncbi:hypothetical protein Tco_1288880 [Tanacetum coccineum]
MDNSRALVHDGRVLKSFQASSLVKTSKGMPRGCKESTREEGFYSTITQRTSTNVQSWIATWQSCESFSDLKLLEGVRSNHWTGLQGLNWLLSDKPEL